MVSKRNFLERFLDDVVWIRRRNVQDLVVVGHTEKMGVKGCEGQ